MNAGGGGAWGGGSSGIGDFGAGASAHDDTNNSNNCFDSSDDVVSDIGSALDWLESEDFNFDLDGESIGNIDDIGFREEVDSDEQFVINDAAWSGCSGEELGPDNMVVEEGEGVCHRQTAVPCVGVQVRCSMYAAVYVRSSVECSQVVCCERGRVSMYCMLRENAFLGFGWGGWAFLSLSLSLRVSTLLAPRIYLPLSLSHLLLETAQGSNQTCNIKNCCTNRLFFGRLATLKQDNALTVA